VLDEHPWGVCPCEWCREELLTWEEKLMARDRIEIVDRVNQYAWDAEFNQPVIAFLFQQLADMFGTMIDVNGGNR
jgi:hypothetical protein